MPSKLPVSVIIATCERSITLARTLESIANQDHQPEEIIIVDASTDKLTEEILKIKVNNLLAKINYLKASKKGAASQRNEGVEASNYNIIGFMDDDILLEENCFLNLWKALNSSESVGGVNAMIINQKYTKPSFLTQLFYRLMESRKLEYMGGRLIGPLINTLPSDDENLGELVKVEWLNTTCTLYKRELLPKPIFDIHFEGYSLMEDLALSLRVSKKSDLLNVRTSRIFHDTQGGHSKDNIEVMSEMELVNRFYVMKNVAGLKGKLPYFKLVLQQIYFGIITKNIFKLGFYKGKLKGLKKIKELY